MDTSPISPYVMCAGLPVDSEQIIYYLLCLLVVFVALHTVKVAATMLPSFNQLVFCSVLALSLVCVYHLYFATVQLNAFQSMIWKFLQPLLLHSPPTTSTTTSSWWSL